MKLIIKKDALESAMKKIGGVYGQMSKKDAAVVVLQAVVGKNGAEVFKGLTITMSNGSSQVATNIFCEMSSDIAEKTSLSVGGELIGVISALSGVKGEFYTITENGGSIVVSVGDNSVTLSKKVEGVMPVAFDVKNPEIMVYGKVALDDGKAFKSAVAKILFAALSDDEKAIGGVAVKCGTDSINFRATDSFRLAQSSLNALPSEEFDFVVSPSVLKLIIATVSNDKVVMIKTEKHLLVQVGNDLWQVALLDKKYPHRIFEDMQKMDRGTVITANKAELLVALDIVGASGKETVTFEVDNEKFVAFGEGRGAKATFSYEADGELPGAITFSNKFFKHCLMAFEGEKVSFSTKKVAVFSAEGEGLFVGLSAVSGK